MSRSVRRVLPVALGFVTAATLFAALTLSGHSAVDFVCSIGTDLDQPAYDRCIAELPARQAQREQDIRLGTAMRPVVALAGGMIVALAALVMVRPRTPVDGPP